MSSQNDGLISWEHLDNMPRSDERREWSYRNQQHIQDTQRRVSGNSAGSDGSNNSGSSYSSFQGVQEPEIDYEDDTNENEAPGIPQSADWYIPRGYRFNHRTFREQPIPPLSPLDQQQPNVRGTDGVILQYDRGGQCAFYDNAWNVPGIRGFRSSNISGGSDSTNPSSYEQVQSAQSSPRYTEPTPSPHPVPEYPASQRDFNHRATESDQSIQKHKGCSLKKICKYIVWTAIFLGISIGVALSTFNNVNTSDLERQMLKGNDEINKTLARSLKMVDQSLKDAIVSVRNGSQTVSNDSSSNSKKTEVQIREMKTMLLTLFEELNRNITSYWMSHVNRGDGSGLGSGSDSGGQCYNSTTKGCVDQCYNICDGDYQSCATCNGYVTCANRILYPRDCPNRFLVWDDHTKTCESVSNTCP
ncbi:uncharacterized protein [Magallana gigas]|uniref:uncharacterized protein n=1 Tax=Magallana gigas TaxID=29159 RepID=UPI00333FD8EE